MNIVMTLLVRDEADIVEHNLRYHLARGIDFVIATDHLSSDGTTDILRDFEREGRLHLVRERDPAFRQSEWVTRMARLAATDFAADWVVNADADEFWWPRGGSFHEILGAVPSRFGAVRGLWRHFVPRPGAAEPFYDRMTVRCASVPGSEHMYIAQVKIDHRGDPHVVVRTGNHDATGERLALLREWYPFEVFHFPIRNAGQMERKFIVTSEGVRRLEAGYVSPHVTAVVEGLRRRSLEDVYGDFLVDDRSLEEGLAAGYLTVDTRLQEAFRSLTDGGSPATDARAGDVTEEFLREVAAHQENDSMAQIQVRSAALAGREQRLAGLRVLRVGRGRAARSFPVR